MKKKYVVTPGYVISKTDGDKHYISYNRLIALYNVDPKECVVYLKHRFNYEGMHILSPRFDGNYPNLGVKNERS